MSDAEIQMYRDNHDDWMARVSALLLLLSDLGHGHHGCNIIERVRSENWHGKTTDEQREIVAGLHPDKVGIYIWGGADTPGAAIAVSPAAFDAMFPRSAAPLSKERQMPDHDRKRRD